MAYTPKIVDAWLTQPYAGYAGQVRYHERNWAGVQAFVVHVQDGNSNGTQMHFRTVLASSTVLIDKDGTIRRLVPESKAPWTNGDVKNPDAQVRALMNAYGSDPNTWTLTIECEGYSGGLPYTEAQYQSILWQLRDWRKRYGNKPVLAHRQINSVTRANCPEPPGGPLLPRLYRDLEGGEAPSAVKVGDTVEATENLNVRKGYGLKYPVVKTLDAGEKGTIGKDADGRFEVTADGYTWLNIAFDGGSGWAASNWLKVIASKPEPTPKPTPPKGDYAKPDPIPDVKGNPAAVVLANGSVLIRSPLTVEATKDTPRLRWASKDSAHIGPVIPKGATFDVAYLIVNPDQSQYWYTSFATRVAFDDTLIVAASKA